MKIAPSRRVRVLLSSLAALAAVAAISVLDWRGLVATIASFHAIWIAIALALGLVQVAFQLLRYWSVHPAGCGPSPLKVWRVIAEGQLVNALAPMRSGDAYKVVRLKALGAETGAVITALVAERAADLIALFGMTTVLALPVLIQTLGRFRLPRIAFFTGVAPFASAAVTFGIAVACAGGLYAGRRRLLPARVRSGIANVTIRFRGMVMESLLSRRLLLGVGVAALAWLLEASVLLCAARAGGLTLSLSQAMACVFILNLGLAIPLTAGNVGVFEASLAFALTATPGVELPLERAVGIATVLHLIQIVGLMIWVGALGIGRVFAIRPLELPASV